MQASFQPSKAEELKFLAGTESSSSLAADGPECGGSAQHSYDQQKILLLRASSINDFQISADGRGK